MANNPRLILNANGSQAISKGILTPPQEIASGFALAITKTNEGEAVPASPPSASLTQFKNVRMIKIVKATVPPPPLSFEKREGRYK